MMMMIVMINALVILDMLRIFDKRNSTATKNNNTASVTFTSDTHFLSNTRKREKNIRAYFGAFIIAFLQRHFQEQR